MAASPRPGARRSLRAEPDGKVLITDGPYLETKEQIGGFWVLEAADLDEPLAWGRKADATEQQVKTLSAMPT